jgi:hypothetical protein
VLFLQGASGNVLPANFHQQADETAARQTGEAIAACACKLLGRAETEPDATLDFAQRPVDLPLSPLPPVAELGRILREREEALSSCAADPTDWAWTGHRTAVEWAKEALTAKSNATEVDSVRLPLQAFGVGQMRILAVPGELFAEFARDLRAAAAGPLMVATLANGCEGYIATSEAFEGGSYEAVKACRFLGLQGFAPNAGHVLCEEADALLHVLQYSP